MTRLIIPERILISSQSNPGYIADCTCATVYGCDYRQWPNRC